MYFNAYIYMHDFFVQLLEETKERVKGSSEVRGDIQIQLNAI